MTPYDLPLEYREHPFVGHLVVRLNARNPRWCICIAVMPEKAFHKLEGNELGIEGEFYVVGLWGSSPDEALQRFESWDEELFIEDRKPYMVLTGNDLRQCDISKDEDQWQYPNH